MITVPFGYLLQEIVFITIKGLILNSALLMHSILFLQAGT